MVGDQKKEAWTVEIYKGLHIIVNGREYHWFTDADEAEAHAIAFLRLGCRVQYSTALRGYINARRKDDE